MYWSLFAVMLLIVWFMVKGRDESEDAPPGSTDTEHALSEFVGTVNDYLHNSDGLQTPDEVAKGLNQPLDEMQRALDELMEDKRADQANGRYGTPDQVQAARDMANRIRDQLNETKALDTVAELANALGESEAKVQVAIDQLKVDGEVGDWNGRYGTKAEVDQLSALGSAIINHLKSTNELLTAADLAGALTQTEEDVQPALDELEKQGQVGQWDQHYGLPEEVVDLSQLGSEIMAYLNQSGLQSASALASAMGEPVDQVQQALDQLKAQRLVEDWNGRYDTTGAVQALRELGERILNQLSQTQPLDSAGELAQALGVPKKNVQSALDELKTQGAVKDWNGRYGTPEEVDQQIELDKQKQTYNTGNSVTNRAIVDTASNLTMVDTAHPMPNPGQLTKWEFWVGNVAGGRQIQLVIYRQTGTAWSLVGSSKLEISKVGLNECALDTPIDVKKGDFIGWYYPGRGVISFDYGGGQVLWGTGSPRTSFPGSGARTYSIRVYSAG